MLSNTHASASVKWQVVATNDPDITASGAALVIVQAEATVAHGATVGFAGDGCYKNYAVEIIDGSAHATVAIRGFVKG